MGESFINDLLLLPLVSQFPSRKEWEKTCWEKLKKSRKLLDAFMTPYERHNIVMRVATIELLYSGKRPLQISRELQISRQTVNSIQKAMKDGIYKSYRERGKTERKKKKYSHDISKKKKKQN